MQLDIINTKGAKTGRTIELPDDIFGIEPNDHVIYLAVKQYQGAQRQGTHKVKTRMEVKGSSKKLHKQSSHFKIDFNTSHGQLSTTLAHNEAIYVKE